MADPSRWLICRITKEFQAVVDDPVTIAIQD